MTRVKYETLKNWVENFGSTLITPEDKYNGTQNFEWICCSCENKNETSYKTFKRWSAKCIECRKKTYKTLENKGPKVKYTYNIILEIFNENGCKLLTLEKDYKGYKAAVEWICYCGIQQKSSFSSFKKYKRCRRCGLRNNHEITYETFSNLLEKEGWKILDSKEKFINTKSLLNVRTNDNEIVQTSYNRFHQGHRTKKEADDSMRHSQEKVEKEFRNRGFILLEIYKNKQTPIEYICSCGYKSKMAYENLTRNKVGCGQCARNKWYETLKKSMKEKYGEDHISKIPEFFKKQQESCFKIKNYKFPSGKIGEIQGYEDLCLDELVYNRNIEEEDIIVGINKVPVIKYSFDRKIRCYYPDIYIKSQNKIIEVKSDYIYNLAVDQNEAKWKAVVELGYQMNCFIYDNKKRLIEERFYKPNGICLRFVE